MRHGNHSNKADMRFNRSLVERRDVIVSSPSAKTTNLRLEMIHVKELIDTALFEKKVSTA